MSKPLGPIFCYRCGQFIPERVSLSMFFLSSLEDADIKPAPYATIQPVGGKYTVSFHPACVPRAWLENSDLWDLRPNVSFVLGEERSGIMVPWQSYANTPRRRNRRLLTVKKPKTRNTRTAAGHALAHILGVPRQQLLSRPELCERSRQAAVALTEHASVKVVVATNASKP